MDKPTNQPIGRIMAAAVLLLTALAVPSAVAQFGMGMQMMKYFSPFGEGFNPGSIKRIDGNIKRVKTSQGRTGPMSIPTVIIVITTEDKTEYHIKLGPIWYIQSMGFRFRKGDRITVTGSLSQADGKQQILCQTIEKEGKVTTYRNAMGIPVWSPVGKQFGGGGAKKESSSKQSMSGGFPPMMMQMMQGGGSAKPSPAPSKDNPEEPSGQQPPKKQGGGMQNMMMQMMQNMMMKRMGGQGGQGGGSGMGAPQGGGNFGGGFGRGFGSGGGQKSGDRSVNTEVEEDVDAHHQDLE